MTDPAHDLISGGTPTDLNGMRVGYTEKEMLRHDDLAEGWFVLFRRWLAEAVEAGAPEPNAMVLATVSADGMPRTRTVLCKGANESGVVFYTGRTSRKGRDLEDRPVASATFLWLPTQRQVHISGPCVPLSPGAAEAYWRERPRGSQIAAWASQQSEPVDDADEMLRLRVAAIRRFEDEDEIPMPERWGGYRLEAERVEFWQGGVDRFHDRLEWLAGEGARGDDDPGAHVVRRLQP